MIKLYLFYLTHLTYFISFIKQLYLSLVKYICFPAYYLQIHTKDDQTFFHICWPRCQIDFAVLVKLNGAIRIFFFELSTVLSKQIS